MKDKFFFSFTTTLLAFLRGEITNEDIRRARFCFNCGVKHALPWTEYDYPECHDKIAYEAAWVIPGSERDPKLDFDANDLRAGRHLISINDLPEKHQHNARAWNILMHQAENEGRLFFSLQQFNNLKSRYEKES